MDELLDSLGYLGDGFREQLANKPHEQMGLGALVGQVSDGPGETEQRRAGLGIQAVGLFRSSFGIHAASASTHCRSGVCQRH